MDLYFIKHTFTAGFYKISDFYTSVGAWNLNENKKLIVKSFNASDGASRVVVNRLLPDNTPINEYTHIIVPEESKVYVIVGFGFVSKKQYELALFEDALLGNYRELVNAKLMLSRTNDPQHFIGITGISDPAIKHISSLTVPATNLTNTAGYYVLYTFQGDAENIEFTFGELDNYPLVGTYSTVASLNEDFPWVANANPYAYDYFLKFAKVSNTLYQCIMVNNDMVWTQVPDNCIYTWTSSDGSESITKGIPMGNIFSQAGDISMINVPFPLDASLVYQKEYEIDGNPEEIYHSIPTFYNIKAFTQSDKLLSIKIVPEDILHPEGLNQFIDAGHYIRPDNFNIDVNYFESIDILGTYWGKDWFIAQSLGSTYMVNRPIPLIGIQQHSLPVPSYRFFRQYFNYQLVTVNNITEYEPFKKYYLNLWGETIEIPARYASELNVRLAITSTDILYEVYTTKHNVIASGRLQWFTRYAVDQLKLFEANNPTYKEQFWVDQLTRVIGGGTLGGAASLLGSSKTLLEMKTPDESSTYWKPASKLERGDEFGLTGESKSASNIGAGVGLGLAGSALGVGTALINQQLMFKGLRDKADAIFGQNDISMSLLKGYGVYMIIITPEADALAQIVNTYKVEGFPTMQVTNLFNLNWQTDGVFTGSYKVVQATLLETIKNNYVTAQINDILERGVVIYE